MDKYGSTPPQSYPDNNSYGYSHVSRPNSPYPPPNLDPYAQPPPPPNYPYPHTHSHSPAYPLFDLVSQPTSHSGPLNYQRPAAPPSQPTSFSGPLAYYRPEGLPPPPFSHPGTSDYHRPPSASSPHSSPIPYPYPYPSFQHHSSFQYGSNYHHEQQSSYPLNEGHQQVPAQPNSFSGHSRHESSSSVGTRPWPNCDNVHDSKPSYPSIYPPIEDLMANTHLSSDHPSAPASPPAPSVMSVANSPQLYQASSAKFDNEAELYGHPNSSFSGRIGSSAHLAHPNLSSFNESQHSQTLQIVPSKGSLKVLLLHGNFDIWVYEAKNLPNMDMFHKTLGDVFSKLPANMGSKLEGHMSNKITSDPYVSVSVSNAVIGRTYVISNNENPVWMQHFYVPVAHYAAEVHFLVKDSDVLGSQLIGAVSIPVEQIYSGTKVEGTYPILNASGKPCKAGAVLNISIQYTPIENLSTYHCGVGSGPDYNGVPGTYFPLRKGGKVTLYQDAHVPDGLLPTVKLDWGMHYVHGKCWHDIFDAIRQARHLIYITGWSVWHKVSLVRNTGNVIRTLGELLKFKSQEGVRVLLLIWDDPTSRSILGFKTDGIMQTHDEETRRYFKNSSVQVLLCPRIAGKRHSWIKQTEVGTIYTHHQKTVIVDTDASNNRRKITAFVGGLDLCDGRYDTPEHPIFRSLQTVHKDDYHNPTFTGSAAGCPREPWHDLHSKIDGPAAYDVLANFEERWLKASKPHGMKKLKKALYDDALLRIERIPQILGLSDLPCLDEHDPETWHVQVFRSIDSNSVKGFPKDPKDATNKNLVCGKNVLIDMSIHTAYIKAIRAAQHFIYIENQYFIGSSYNWSSYKDLGANNLIPMEIALKIADKIRANERFAAYIVIPMWPEGVPTGAATQRILFWQNKTMQMMYETIYKALVEVGIEDSFSPQDYLNFFCLGNREVLDGSEASASGSPSAENTPQALFRKSRRFMIYVHSKGMIVDDEYVIVGSANINQRSLEGTRDTEIAMGAYQPCQTWARKLSHPHGQIYGYRMSLWAEHTGVLEDCFVEPESVECVRRIRLMGETNWKQFVANEVTEMRGHLLKYPVEVDAKGKVKPLPGCETFPDVGGNIVGSFVAIQENLTI